jgi:hypothetical protein
LNKGAFKKYKKIKNFLNSIINNKKKEDKNMKTKKMLELEDITNLEAVFVCNDINEYYRETGKIGLLIKEKNDVSILKNNFIDFELVICKSKGNYYVRYRDDCYNFDSAQKILREIITSSTNYFYKDDYTEIESIKEDIQSIFRHEFYDFDDFKNKVLKVFDESKYLVPGYYDYKGNLVISEEEISSANFCELFEDDENIYKIIALVKEEEEEEQEQEQEQEQEN